MGGGGENDKQARARGRRARVRRRGTRGSAFMSQKKSALTRQRSSSSATLAPIRIDTPGLHDGGISLESPHLTGLSAAFSGGCPLDSPPSQGAFDPDAWKAQHAPSAATAIPPPVTTARPAGVSTRAISTLSGGSGGGGGGRSGEPKSPGKRKSPLVPGPIQTFSLAAGDEDVDGVPVPDSPSKRRSFERPANAPPLVDAPPVTVTDVFAPGMMRCPVFRIPCVLPLPAGVVLAFAEARQSWHDHGVIDLVCRRSEDDGYTWGTARTVCTGASIGKARLVTVGNPAAVWDGETKTVWLLFCSNLKEDQEWQIHAGQGRSLTGRQHQGLQHLGLQPPAHRAATPRAVASSA